MPSGCLYEGVRYGPGSAMMSSRRCEYCYCIGGNRRCIRPKCLLSLSGCRPQYSPHSCCPVSYDCNRKFFSSDKSKTENYRLLSLFSEAEPSTTLASISENGIYWKIVFKKIACKCVSIVNERNSCMSGRKLQNVFCRLSNWWSSVQGRRNDSRYQVESGSVWQLFLCHGCYPVCATRVCTASSGLYTHRTWRTMLSFDVQL